MEDSRIPSFNDYSHAGIERWFGKMDAQDLLFHPDDAPDQIVPIADNRPIFTTEECAELRTIITTMFTKHGDAVYNIAYPFFMKHLRSTRRH